MTRIVIELLDGNIKVSLPEDPILALGLLEIAKTHVQKKLMGIEEKNQSRIIVPGSSGHFQ